MHQYFIIYKPYSVLSQFTTTGGKRTLADIYAVPKTVYPVGRLDYDSEGLLILSNDSHLNHLLLHPKHQHEREYWVQVEGLITPEALQHLATGITISIDGKPHRTMPCKVYKMDEPPKVHERIPPIRFRKEIPVSWISLSITEGKNRQVRRMTAAVGFPTLRLLRYRIENITLDGLTPGGIKELTRHQLYNNLRIK